MRRASRVEVGGYTDSVGGPAFNRDLARRRALAVKRFLVRRGRVPARLLVVRAYGETRPLATNATEIGRQRNRRVVLVVTLKRGTTQI